MGQLVDVAVTVEGKPVLKDITIKQVAMLIVSALLAFGFVLVPYAVTSIIAYMLSWVNIAVVVAVYGVVVSAVITSLTTIDVLIYEVDLRLDEWLLHVLITLYLAMVAVLVLVNVV